MPGSDYKASPPPKQVWIRINRGPPIEYGKTCLGGDPRGTHKPETLRPKPSGLRLGIYLQLRNRRFLVNGNISVGMEIGF